MKSSFKKCRAAFAFLLAALLILPILSVSGSGAFADEESPLSSILAKFGSRSQDPASDSSFAGRICGRYLYQPSDAASSDEYIVEFFCLGGNLFAEVAYLSEEYSTYAYHLSEFEPLSDTVLASTSDTTAAFLIRRFSGFAMAGEYWEDAKECSVSIVDGGLLCSAAGDYTDIFLTRCDERPSIHSCEDLKEYFAMAESPLMEASELKDTGIVGQWGAVVHDAGIYARMYFEFAEDGTMCFMRKIYDEPIEIYRGVYTLDPAGSTIHSFTHRAGYGDIPHYGEWILADSNPPMLYNSEYSDLWFSTSENGSVTLIPFETRTPAEWEEALFALSLDNLRNVTTASDALCAVAYIGYSEGPMGDGYQSLFAEEGYLTTYSFLTQIPYDRYSFAEGGEIYCIVPADENASVTVSECTFSDAGIVPSKVLYRSDSGEPFIVQGNISDIFSNLQIDITNEDGSSFSFQPSLSLKDGTLYTGETEAVLDFTLYDYAETALSPEDLIGDWTSFWAIDSYGNLRTCSLTFIAEDDGTISVEYWHSYPEGDITERFVGTCYAEDSQYGTCIVLDMMMVGGVAIENGVEPYPLTGTFQFFANTDDEYISLYHIEGSPLFNEGEWIEFVRSYG